MSDAPLHPATVHFPIAFLSLAWALDIYYGLITSTGISIPIISSYMPPLHDIARASYYLSAVGFLGSFVSIATGAQQLIAMYNNGQAFEADKKTMRPKFKLVLLHAGLNDLAAALGGYSWYIKRDTVGFLPTRTNTLLSAVAWPIMLYSAKLGGDLVYHYGMGVNVAKARKEKEKAK